MAFKIGTKIIEILQYAKQLFLHDDFIRKVAQDKHISKQKTAYKPINWGVPLWVRLSATILFVPTLTKRIFASILHAHADFATNLAK
ncbi:hypothetical protein EZS27_019772 [termite gut metagenome]|uniref:Uncharacterized protein n=1 Tax=termite gut metagenome TaxID=433724 RepID=A0A5J4RD91_9ZZZZ